MLSPASLQQIDREIAKYPPERKQSAVISALRIAQVEKGSLATEIMDFIAVYLDMPPIAVYEVASFYAMYDLAPVGRHKVTVCTNLPCRLTGADDIAEYLKKKLGIAFNETTADGRFTLKEGQCFGACGDAPLCLVGDDRMCGFLTPEQVDKLLDSLE